MAYPREISRRRHDGSAHALAQGLGWFSIGLGLAEVLAPRSLAGFLGMEKYRGLIRAYGVREIATGVGILSQDEPTPWIWGRVGGDMLDLATLTTALRGDNPRQNNVGRALIVVAGVTLLDMICARLLSTEGKMHEHSPPMRDYRSRSGLPHPPDAMRGIAMRDFEVPRDMQTPEALRAYASG